MTISELDEGGQQFLIQLFEQTGGDSSVQVSMYDIGEGVGLDRDHSRMPALDQSSFGWDWERRKPGENQGAAGGMKKRKKTSHKNTSAQRRKGFQ